MAATGQTRARGCIDCARPVVRARPGVRAPLRCPACRDTRARAVKRQASEDARTRDRLGVARTTPKCVDCGTEIAWDASRGGRPPERCERHRAERRQALKKGYRSGAPVAVAKRPARVDVATVKKAPEKVRTRRCADCPQIIRITGSGAMPERCPEHREERTRTLTRARRAQAARSAPKEPAPKQCLGCGATLEGVAARAQRCPGCRDAHARRRKRERARHRRGTATKRCADCAVEMPREEGRAGPKRCPSCRIAHTRALKRARAAERRARQRAARGAQAREQGSGATRARSEPTRAKPPPARKRDGRATDGATQSRTGAKEPGSGATRAKAAGKPTPTQRRKAAAGTPVPKQRAKAKGQTEAVPATAPRAAKNALERETAKPQRSDVRREIMQGESAEIESEYVLRMRAVEEDWRAHREAMRAHEAKRWKMELEEDAQVCGRAA